MSTPTVTQPAEEREPRSEHGDPGDPLDFISQVLRQIEVAVRAGSALPVDPPALTAVLDELRQSVVRQLKAPDLPTSQKKWFDDSRNVILAANVLGTVGTCIARLNHQDVVDYDVLFRALELVKTECSGRFGPEGCYCGCPDKKP